MTIMDSIAIPVNVIRKLNRNNSTNNDKSNNGNGSSDCCFEPVILYYDKLSPPSPPPDPSLSIKSASLTSASSTTTSIEERQNQDLFIILNNVIPVGSSTISSSLSSPSSDIIKLHPFLEEFMVLSAKAIAKASAAQNPHSAANNDNDSGDNKGATNNSHLNKMNANNDITLSSSTSVSIPSKPLIVSSLPNSIPVLIEYVHPPEYYNDDNVIVNANTDNDNDNDDGIDIDTDADNEDHVLFHEISKQKFHLQKVHLTSIHDLTKSISSSALTSTSTSTSTMNNLNMIDMKLEFIYCSNEYYEQWFISMGRRWSKDVNSDRKNDNNNDNNSSSNDNNDDDHNNYIYQIDQYIHDIICQALEYRTIKKFMILPIELPQFPHYDDEITSTNNSGEGEESPIVAFFKLQDLHIKTKRRNEQDDGMDDNYNNNNNSNSGCYRIGTIIHNSSNIDTDETMNNTINNIVSIEITLSPGTMSMMENENEDITNIAEIDINVNNQEQKGKDDNGNVIGDGNDRAGDNDNQRSSYCPGYDNIVQDIISMANISVESASPTGILLSGCTGVGKTKLALSVFQSLNNRTSTSMINMISAKDILLQASSSMIDIASLKKMIIPSNSTTNMMTNSRSGIIHKTKEQNKQQQQQQILIIDDLDILLEGSSDDESGTFLFDERRATLHAILESIDEIVQERSKGGGITKHYNLPFILGICCSDSFNIPPILNRIGRFEKIVTMLPPSEVQRREILRFMINQLPIANNHSIKDDGGNPMSTEKLIEVWSVALARTTAGCVASDLKRICIDALTRSKSRNSKVLSNANDILSHRMDDGEGEEGILWEEIREATRSCIPSQLAQLDVSIPRDENEHFDTSLLVDKRDTKERFQQSWQSFGGYSEMKANLFRTVFRPWCRRHFDGGDNYPMSQLEREVPPPTGILFHGPSGTGKTFAADCLARSLGLNVVKVKASDILDQWLGGSEAAIRSIFARTRAAAPCILLFDELDALATNREVEDGGSTDVYSRLLSTLLNEMDGVNSGGGDNSVLVVGTTNRIHAIDAALLRPGRFEKHILLQKPTINDIEEIMKLHLSKAPLDQDVNFSEISELLHELAANGADIRGICTETCLIAMRDADTATHLEEMFVRTKDFDEAIRVWKK